MSIVEQPRAPSFKGARVLQDTSRLKGRLALPVLLYLMAVVLPIGFGLGPIYMTGVRLLLIVLIVPLTGMLLMGRFGRVLPTDILFLLHVLWLVVALAINNPDQVIKNAGSTGIEFIGGYVVGRAFIRTRADFIALVRIMVTTIVILLPFALYEAQTGKAMVIDMLNKLPGISSLPDISIGRRMGFDRVQGVFAHPIHWGLYCSLVLPLCFVGLRDIYPTFWRIVLSVVIGFSGVLALSSGALLAIMLQLGLLTWAWMFRSTTKRWIILLALFAFMYVIVDLLSNRKPLMVFLSYATFSSHTAYWRTLIFDWGMINIWANPIFGIGLNEWVRPAWMHTSSVDNFWLLTGMRYGIPGFLFVAGGYGLALWKISRRKFDDDRVLWNLRRAWVFGFIGLTFTLTTVHVWHAMFSFVFFIFGAGMWMLTVTPDTDDKAAQDAAQSNTNTPRPGSTFTGQNMTREKDSNGAAKPAQDSAADNRPTNPYTRFPTKGH